MHMVVWKCSYLNFFCFLVLCSRITTTRTAITSISTTKTAPIAPPSAATFTPLAAGSPVTVSDSQSPASNDSSCVGHEGSTSSLVESTLIEVPLCAHVDTNATRPSAVYRSSPKAVYTISALKTTVFSILLQLNSKFGILASVKLHEQSP